MVAGNICKIEGCKNILKKTEGRICQMHRSRKFRHGNYDISPNWTNLKKGQPCITPLGYIRININGERVLQHRYIMEQHLGRKLKQGERIHHINGDKIDNRIENLELFSNNSEHMKKYHLSKWKKRKVGREYSSQDIKEISKRITRLAKTYNTCFCGRKLEAKNLCGKHYQWAYKHQIYKIIRYKTTRINK